MQASVLFSLAVSTDFTVAAGKRGTCALRRSSKGPVTAGERGRGRGGAKNRTRETESSPFQKDDEEE